MTYNDVIMSEAKKRLTSRGEKSLCRFWSCLIIEVFCVVPVAQRVTNNFLCVCTSSLVVR